MVAALFVASGGCYFGLDGVDPWDESRDARGYLGPYPVVAHPPCARWCRYATGGPSHPGTRSVGDDGGCFASALESLRKWGGVLEHPKDSKAFTSIGWKPGKAGWTRTTEGVWLCQVEQGNYGHRARKATWLAWYCRDRTRRPFELIWGKSNPVEHQEAHESGRVKRGVVERMSKRQREATPPAFRDVLIALAELGGSQ
jgi:hypothetical protein